VSLRKSICRRDGHQDGAKGGFDLEFDPDGNVWLSMMYQAGIASIDRETEEV
jgi:hypothetical protein